MYDPTGGWSEATRKQHMERLRVARAVLREFLRCTPRDEPDETVKWVDSRGVARCATRAMLAAHIDAMRPRLRRVMQMLVEQQLPRKEICARLNVSTKTLERESYQGLNILADRWIRYELG